MLYGPGYHFGVWTKSMITLEMANGFGVVGGFVAANYKVG